MSYFSSRIMSDLDLHTREHIMTDVEKSLLHQYIVFLGIQLYTKKILVLKEITFIFVYNHIYIGRVNLGHIVGQLGFT